MRLVAQPFGLGDGEQALVDLDRNQIRLYRGRQRWSERGWRRPHRPLGLPSFAAEMLGQHVLPAAIVAGWPWNRGRVVRVEADPGIGRHGDCGPGNG